MARFHPPNPVPRPGPPPVPLQPRRHRQEDGGADSLGPPDRAERHLRGQGQDRDTGPDVPHGRGHEQRRGLDPVQRVRRVPVLHLVLFGQVHQLQATWLQ